MLLINMEKEYIVAIITGSFLTMGAIITGFFKRKELIKDTSHAKGFSKSHQVREIINRVKLSQKGVVLITVAKIKNGGHNGDPTEPKYLSILESTDFQTWEEWRAPEQMEPEHVNIHSSMLELGHSYFKPSQLRSRKSKDWLEFNKIKQVSAHTISVNKIKGESIVMYINYAEEFVLNASAIRYIAAECREIAKLYAPNGWFAKKNYLSS